jgi:hypothetical protein
MSNKIPEVGFAQREKRIVKIRIAPGSDSPPKQIVITHQRLIRRLERPRLAISIGDGLRQCEQQQRTVGFVVGYFEGGEVGVDGGHKT